MATDERAEVRGAHTETPGRGHLIEQLLGQRANRVAYGQDTSELDAQLAELGWTPQATRAAAAAERKAAAKQKDEDGQGDGGAAKQQPPAGRTARPRQST